MRRPVGSFKRGARVFDIPVSRTWISPNRKRQIMRLKQRIYYMLEGGSYGQWLSNWLSSILVIAVLISVAAMILETVPMINKSFGIYLHWLEVGAAGIFTVEYILRLWTATEDRKNRYTHPVLGRLRYMMKPLAIIDLLAVLPFYLAAVFPYNFLFLRLFRLIRLLKLIRYSPALATLVVVFRNEGKSWSAAFIIMITMLVFASSLMWMFEHEAQPTMFSSIPAAMWWAMATLTTVGYGDFVPITPAGRMLGSMIMLFGIAMFTLPAVILASGFAREFQKQSYAVSVSMVGKVPLFKDLHGSILVEITNLLTTRIIPARFALLRPGETLEALFFIVEGEVEIEMADGWRMTLSRGDFFGETSLLETHDSYVINAAPVSVTSLQECRMLVLEGDDFKDLRTRLPHLEETMLEIAKNRVSRT